MAAEEPHRSGDLRAAGLRGRGRLGDRHGGEDLLHDLLRVDLAEEAWLFTMRRCARTATASCLTSSGMT